MLTKDERRRALMIVGCSIVALVLFIGGYHAIRWFTADYRGEVKKREQTIANGSFRIATYEEFFDLCSSVQSTEQKIKTLEEELATKPSEDRAERLRTSLTALKNTRAESIATYNSKATQEHRQAFQDAALPYRLDNTTQETQCAA